jgi:hypothetical protein
MGLYGVSILFVILVLGSCLVNYQWGTNVSTLLLCECRCRPAGWWEQRCPLNSPVRACTPPPARLTGRPSVCVAHLPHRGAAPALPIPAVIIAVLYFLLALIIALLISALFMGCNELEPLAVRLAPAQMTPLLRCAG